MPKNTVKRRQLFTAANFGLVDDDDVDDEVKPSEIKKEEKKEKKSVKIEERSQKKEDPNDVRRCSEASQNVFTRFYEPNYPVREEQLEEVTPTKQCLKTYQHCEAVAFADATWKWMKIEKRAVSHSPRPRKTTDLGIVPTYTNFQTPVAYYRVVVELPNRYILMACHQNVHGAARGDLRFVEVNDETKIRGMEEESVIGALFLGDILAVGQLEWTGNFGKEEKMPKTKDVGLGEKMNCHWSVHTASILPRTIRRLQKFAVMENGKAIVNGHGESMIVKASDPRTTVSLDPNTVYIGDVFIPERIDSNYTEDHHPGEMNRMILLSSEFPSIPESRGTIFNFVVSPSHSEMFAVGTDAFKNPFHLQSASETLEFCALIGYSAAKTVFDSTNDYRKFVMHEPRKDENLVRFWIDNPKENPTDGFWHSNGQVRFTSQMGGVRKVGVSEVRAAIETVICEGNRLRLTARLSRDAPEDLSFLTNDVFVVQQRSPMDTPVIQTGFFSTMDMDSNGAKIIKTLYGGQKFGDGCSGIITKNQYIFPSSPGIPLNEFQCEYVCRVLQGIPIVIANSPFGCGKSMTIVTASLYLFEEHKRRGGPKTQQLLITQSNYASVNLVDIALKTLARVKDVKFMRYVSESNWKQLPDACRTELDMPKMMNDVLIKWATNQDKSVKFAALTVSSMVQIVSYVLKTLNVSPCRLNSLALSVQTEAIKTRPPWPRQLMQSFFTLYQPDIIIVTATSLPGLLASRFFYANSISNVQIDEASQLAEYTLLSLLTLVPDAKFGLIGDIQQLAPYCEEELTGKLKDYGIGNAMERAVKECMFPQVILKTVYRCHPATTALLGELFYSNELISGVTAEQRTEFMSNRPHFWPNSSFPIMVVDNKSPAQPMGSSFGNEHERQIVKQLVDFLTNTDRKKYVLAPEDIGVISYYSAQTSMLTEMMREVGGVKCGTVDSFQGSEREVIVLCCTNDDIQEFMQVANRLNVAMSRSRQVTILVGNVEMLRKAEHWSTIIERCAEHGCVVDTNKYPFKVAPPGAEATNKKASKTRCNKNVNKLAKELRDIVLTSKKSKK